jgi:hypothetical protein
MRLSRAFFNYEDDSKFKEVNMLALKLLMFKKMQLLLKLKKGE